MGADDCMQPDRRRSDFYAERDAYLASVGLRVRDSRPFQALGAAALLASTVKDGRFRGGVAFDNSRDGGRTNISMIGGTMENTDALLRAVNGEVAESKKTLESLANEVRALADIVGPALLAQAKELRASRMAVVGEVRESLTALRDVRKFFLESEYETEMARLERLVRVCREIQALKAAGVFDAVCDSALRLAVKE